MKFLLVGLMACVGLMGCGKTPVAKETAQVNSDSLTLQQADAILAEPVITKSAATQTVTPTVTGPAVANMVENKDAGPLVDTPTTIAPASVAAAADTAVVDTASDSSDTPDGAAIQKALKNLGLYSGVVDGKIGPKTKEAIREFQRKNNLTVDGKVGPKTWELLQKAQG
jgi:peptidoglycan hydrolase-like protein with peptidoglycan-binding domain